MSTYTPARRLESVHPYPDMHDITLHLAGDDSTLDIGGTTLYPPMLLQIFTQWAYEVSLGYLTARRGYEDPQDWKVTA